LDIDGFSETQKKKLGDKRSLVQFQSARPYRVRVSEKSEALTNPVDPDFDPNGD
jgi:hypothetical protein